MNKSAIVLFRQDLRLEDNPALHYACTHYTSILPLFLWDTTNKEWDFGSASKWWLHHSLQSLHASLIKRGAPLYLKRGEYHAILEKLFALINVDAVFWNRQYEPHSITRDTKLKSWLNKKGIEAKSFNGSLLYEPWEVTTKQNTPCKVFTSFWKSCLKEDKEFSLYPAPKTINSPSITNFSDSLDSWKLLPRHNWANLFEKEWMPGEEGAKKRLEYFVQYSIDEYVKGRDIPSKESTSKLSPHLHFGETSPKQVVIAIKKTQSVCADKYLSEIGWREFSHHLLYHFPKLPSSSFNEKFSQFPWESNPAALKKWQKGMTGYPIVDAGMRQLWKSGWMHNRVRMIVGSFLTKDLLIPWQEGAKWFWDTLVDADLANNSASWQWIAGCGADAAPFFRIFNPVLQGEKFDPEGAYVKEWVPELKKMPGHLIHKPWEASQSDLSSWDVELGTTYPNPIVDHKLARTIALESFQKIKE